MQFRSFTRLAGVVAAAWVALNLPLLLGLRVLPSDAMNEFYPMVYFNVHSIREGLAPWWNPYIFGGYPQIADPQALFFAPLFMAWMLLRSDPGTTWFVWGALLHVLMGGVAFAAYVRRVKANDFGALMGALVFMAGGVAASRIQYVPILLAYSFIPVALLALRLLVERPALGRGALLGLAAGAILVEPVQLTYLTGFVLLAYASMLAVRGWPAWSPAERWRLAGAAIVAGTIAIGMALPQLLFSYAFVAVSNRPELGLESATSMSVDWRSLLTLFDPNALQSLRGRYTGPVDPIETFYYVGALPAVLVAAGVRNAWREPMQRRHLVFFGLVAIVAVLYMMAAHTPLYAWLYRTLPGIKQFRRPSDSAYLLNLAIAVAVAFSASWIDLRDRRWMKRILGVTCLWLLLASAGMHGQGEGWQVASIVAAIAAGFFLFRSSRLADAGKLGACLLFLVVVDYRCFNLNGEFNQRGDSGKRFRQDPASAFLAARLKEAAGGLTPRLEAFDLGAAWKNLVVLKDLPATHGYGPLRWKVFDHWYGAYSDGNGPRPNSPFNPDPGSAMNALLGVRYVVAPAGTDTSRWSTADGEVASVYQDAKTAVFQMDHAYPRVLTPERAEVFALGQSPSPAHFSAPDFASIVLLTPRDANDAATTAADATRCTGRLAVASATSTNIETTVHTEGPSPGWLVITDQDFPGWVTRIDGHEAEHHRANGLLRAVCVPGGQHTVTFRYEPWRMVAQVLRSQASWQ